MYHLSRRVAAIYSFIKSIKSDSKSPKKIMATASPLLGPPSLRDSAATGGGGAVTILHESTLVGPTADASQNDPVSAIADKTKTGLNLLDEKPIRGFTENMSATFLTTGNPCLDLFFKVVPDTPPESVIGLLEIAWASNPLMTLKLICNLRGVRGTGKSDKEGFYTAALWLHHMHPKTLAGNVKAIAEFGYFKDFLEILYRILEGPTVREIQKEERQLNRRRRGYKRSRRHYHGIVNQIGYEDQQLGDYEYQNEHENEENLLGVNEESDEVRNENEFQDEENNAAGNENKEKTERTQKKERTVKTPQDIKREKEEARALRKEKERNKAKKALEMYNGDEDYRLLHDSVAGFFEELLKADLEKLKSGKLNEISLAAKWCPAIDSSYDKATLICESIARKTFPREKNPEYEGLEERHYVYRVRDRLRKDVLVPLHKALELPEVYMSANKWNTLPYNRVPSVAMKKYQKLFSAHDKERFAEYLENVKSGKAKIAAGALLPHEIIGAVQNEDEHEVAELQWKRLVDDMTQKGMLSNCIAVCDVSGSMSGIPMEVSVALGILVSELSEEPWKGKLITFSDNPEIQEVQGDTLLEKSEFVRDMEWGMSTNFQGVFDRILELAVEGKLKEEQLVKRVFVFSDMEFNEASSNPWETDYQAIQRKYSEHGYNSVPEIVFWNLRDSRSIPVAGKQSGVALVSGFSKNLLNIFLDGGGIVNPVEVMELAIAGEEYKKLAVFD